MNSFKLKSFLLLVAALLAAAGASAGIAEKASRTKASGVDLITYPMGVEDVVTIVGMLPAGDIYAADGNISAASLTGMMLDRGTTTQDKFAIAKQLDSVGAQIGFSVGTQVVAIKGVALKKDVPRVIRLLAEQLRSPALSADEFEKAKTQFEGGLRPALEDTGFRADDAFNRLVFPQKHPNRTLEIQKWLDASKALTLDEVKAFHKKYYGPAHMTLIFVGDVDGPLIRKEVSKAFAGWTGGVDVDRTAKGAAAPAQLEQTIAMKEKTSVSVILGQASGLRYSDADRLPLAVGTAILGSGFTGRLMSTVRDKEGLTYGIGAGLSDDAYVDGKWAINADFAPALVAQGVASTRRELQKWYQDGVSATELAGRKTNMIGTFQVGLATTGGMAGAMLQTLSRDKPLSWLDDFPKAIDALTVDQVNAAIKKRLDPAKMVLVEAGTLEAPK